jgi:hypothetical protein
MPHLKLSKKYFWDKKIEKQTKIATHMDLWKYSQILTIQKSLSIKVSKEKILHLNLSSCITLYFKFQ